MLLNNNLQEAPLTGAICLFFVYIFLYTPIVYYSIHFVNDKLNFFINLSFLYKIIYIFMSKKI